ncbi:GNAT family N-acetyltransferase [Deinococcus cellulosilyticus]|uniref:N-acetyltransferase domain-containing protein n=1 Tax=Deinococcus cellulosilyticus (strain DSM 18568 / NBRC 106333 / KACC 11606 / 5516J-15) TaxID=1223518 RepID=A0A511N326_DEIC1|nr:GNAT family N-acetyltransferase [Deinococcus cellulosilyticus]GEM47259.1 hypothetical protein DC3_28940 [Deinococcus cellulosilyticus NBRC 106333 = KACC 11606]
MLDYSFTRPIRFEDLRLLMQQTTWMGNRTPEGVQRMLQDSVVVSVWSGDQLVGFGRAVTDHVYRAFIEDIVVDEKHRHAGVGSELMSRLVDHLKDVEEIQLGCVEELVSFYGALGFERSSQPKMILRRDSR